MKIRNMNKDELKDWIETTLGGLCGVVAIIAAICEYLLGEQGAIAGMIKDIASTAVVVALLFAVMPTKKSKNLVNILENSVEKWGADNSPMIFKIEGYVCAKEQKYSQGFALLQNPTKYVSLLDMKQSDADWHTYASYTSKQTGKFLDLPSYEEMVADGFDVLFILEQKHFKEIEGIDEVIQNIADATQNRFGEKNIKVHRIGKSEKFTIKFKSAIENKKDIEFFISVVDFVLSLVKVIA